MARALPIVIRLLPAMAAIAAAQPIADSTLDRSVYEMGTVLDLHLIGLAPVLGPASEKAIREVERIESACSTWRESSAWSQLNRARGASVTLDPEWISLLSSALDWQRRTEGTFDPVLGALMRAWGIRKGGREATADEVAQARANSGARLLTLDPVHHTARLRRAAAAIDEGGFVKGYALDRAREVLKSSGVDGGYLNFGGQVLAWGPARRVDIADPSDRLRATLSVLVENASLSSSGTSEHGRHILDPRSGDRCPAWGSVAVVMPTGLAADVLSKALYVMGPASGLAWANAHHIPAFLQPNDGPALVSEDLRSLKPESIARLLEGVP